MEHLRLCVIFGPVSDRAENRILVVDDDVALTKRITEILTREGYTALSSYDPDEAEEIARSRQPHLVISDFHMPGRNGLSLLAALRAYPPTQDVPVILLTGESWEKVGNECHSHGLDVFLKKPLDVDVLLSVIERQLLHARKAEVRLDSFRSRVTATIPHELRTPLAGIIGLGSLLAEHASSLAANPQQIETFGKAVLSSGERLQRLVESYILYVQLEAGQILSLEASGIDIDPAEEIRTTAKNLAARYEREADLAVHQNADDIVTEEHKAPVLVKIAGELIDNACKFSPPGTPIEVAIVRDHRGSQDETIEITVRDQGRGMKPSQIEQIAPFVQFDREVYEQQGSGLGLSLSQRLASAIGATLQIVAPPEGGLAVTLTQKRSAHAS